MTNFRFGYNHIDKHLSFKSTDFIVLAQRPGMGFENLLLNASIRTYDSICYICTELKEEKIKFYHKKIKSNYKQIESFNFLVDERNNKSKNLKIVSLELPNTIELIEFIMKNKSDFNYFIIDNLSFIDKKINQLFNEDKNYQNILRHLKVLSILIKKNIILLADIDYNVERNKKYKTAKFGYYNSLACKEKYIDYLITLFRPQYYGMKTNIFEEEYEMGYTFLNVAKTKRNLSQYEFSLTYEESLFTFT